MTGEVAAKLARVRGWLDGSDYDAALFSSQPGVAWVTAGLEDRVVRNEEPALVWALVTGPAAWLITTNIEQPRILAEQDTAGFSVHAVPWYSPRAPNPRTPSSPTVPGCLFRLPTPLTGRSSPVAGQQSCLSSKPLATPDA